MNVHTTLAIALAISFIPRAAVAQPHGGDIILSITDNRIVTSTIEGESIVTRRVFESEFGAFDFTDEPGFDSEAGAFPGSSLIGFNIRAGLRFWNGAAFPADASGIAAERLRIRKSGFGDVLTPTTDTITPGFGVDVSAGGEFHQHLGFTLQAPNGAGIYLLELELWSSVSSITVSEPFWIVFNNDMPEADHEAAVAWALDNLVAPLCSSDVNGDTESDILDFLDFIDSFGACENQPAPCAGSSGIDADFNGDTFVDILDFLDFIDAFAGGCD